MFYTGYTNITYLILFFNTTQPTHPPEISTLVSGKDLPWPSMTYYYYFLWFWDDNATSGMKMLEWFLDFVQLTPYIRVSLVFVKP